MYATSAILTAQIQRGKSGRGSRVEVAKLEALSEWMGYALYFDHYSCSPTAGKFSGNDVAGKRLIVDFFLPIP